MSEQIAVAAAALPALDETQKEALLALVAEQPGIGIARALRDIGVPGTKGQLRALADRDRDLADDIQEARGRKLRGELMARAVDGVEEPIVNAKGDVVGERVVKSDRLLEFACRMYLPEARALRGVEVTGRDGGPLEVANPDVAAAIDRFTTTVRRLTERSQPGGAVRDPQPGPAELPPASAG